MRPEFSAVTFLDPAKAEANLEQLEQLLAPELRFPLASLLAQSPDPDGALNLLERYAGRAPAEVLSDLTRYPTALTYLVAIFGYSSFLAEAFLSEPGLPVQFAKDRNFIKLKSKEDLMQDYARFATSAPSPWLSAQLGQFKRRTYLRIVLKDVLGIATLAETTLELSELADVIAMNALIYCDQELRKRYGEPQYRDAQGRIARSEFSVISLGKMGGNELNYSSDIDLLFLYSRDGETSGGREPDSVISNKEYFVRLASAITRTITQSTPYGQVFRVDLRLRPEGDQGDMTISLKSALEYYEHRARDWELQMLIKARHSAGDEKLTREFLRGVESYVYGSPANFEAIETVLLTREKISKNLKRGRSETIDVKRHHGGIRDIEFLTQCLQRLHGGRDLWVRSGGTPLALRKLNDKGWLSDRDYAALTGAYEFLRKVEHRIQLDLGQQAHRLPSEAAALDKLARRVGVDRGAQRRPPATLTVPVQTRPGTALIAHLEEIFKNVEAIYQKLIHPVATPGSREEYALKPSTPLMPEHAASSYEAAMRLLNAQAPDLAERVAEASIPERARKNAARFMSNLFGSSEHFSLARRHPEQLVGALQIISASEYLAELLIHHPEDMMVLDSASLSGDEPLAPVTPAMHPPPGGGGALTPRWPAAGEHPCAGQEERGDTTLLAFEAPQNSTIGSPEAAPFHWILNSGWGLREQMALLRRHYRIQTLALGGRSCAATTPIFSALKDWSVLAARSISTALGIATETLKAAPGLLSPPALGNELSALPFVILGLGRLGMREFDLASDADLLFVVPSGAAEQEMEFWTHLAEKVIEAISTYTSDGALFAVDTRLRPMGREGELVVTEDALLSYVDHTAKVWEGLTYLKACPVGGNNALGQEVTRNLVGRVLSRFSGAPNLEDELQQMRRRLERELTSSPTDPKTAPGGYYDVDYALAYLRLRHRVNVPPGANTPEQLRAVQLKGLLREEDAKALQEGAGFLRSLDHAVRLVTGRPCQGLPEHVGHAALVEELARRWGLLQTQNGEEPLAMRLRDIQQGIRYVYRRLVGSE